VGLATPCAGVCPERFEAERLRDAHGAWGCRAGQGKPTPHPQETKDWTLRAQRIGSCDRSSGAGHDMGRCEAEPADHSAFGVFPLKRRSTIEWSTEPPHSARSKSTLSGFVRVLCPLRNSSCNNVRCKTGAWG